MSVMREGVPRPERERLVVALDELGPADLSSAGGKACRLAELRRAGVRVPDAVVVLAGAFQEHLEAAGLDGAARDAAELRQGVVATPLPEALARTILEALRKRGLHPEGPLVVRSSAAREDGADRSAAGVLTSVCGVRGEKEVLRAVRACWASLWGERAQAYWSGGGSDGDVAPAMGVLIQQAVPCEASGVLFTMNPLTGREEEMLVEVAPGPGGGVVSGLVSPDRYVLGFWDGEVRSARPAPGGQGPVVGEQVLVLLAETGRRVQEVFGRPQDIEFGVVDGRVHVFQARPITAWSFAADTGEWTSANFREVMPGFASTLGQSLSLHHDFARAQEELFRRLGLWRPEDEGTVWARTFFGHAYWNVGATKRVAARIPGFCERSFDRTVGIEPLYEGDGRVTPWTPATVLQAVPVLLALGRQYRRVPEEARTFLAWFDAEEPTWDLVDPEALDDDALAARVTWGLDLHSRTNRWALLVSLLSTQAQEDFHRTLAALERKVPEELRPSEARLLTGLDGMATARPLHDLWDLACRLEGVPGFRAALRVRSPAELAAGLGELARDGPAAAAWREVLAWLARYRHMANVDEDLSVPRWSEDPAVPLAVLRSYVLGGAGPGESPAAQLERQRRVREEEAAKARELGRRWWRWGLDPLWGRRFEGQYALVKKFCWWREETRVYLSRARYHCRRALVEQGRRWAEAGRLDRPEDIFWLELQEVLGLVRGEADFGEVAERARRRASVARLFRDFPVPPNILPGPFGPDGLPLRRTGRGEAGTPPGDGGGLPGGPERASGGPAEEGRVLQGVGCSAGRVTAPCRVVTRLEEAASLRSGEILVARYANPGWVPLFHLAAGLVLEEGGLLSHCAVVAREYGLPAVVQLKEATRILRDGDVVTLDGDFGTVTVDRTRTRP
ncbi:MAG: hypothetical protein K6U08_00205 [Firmicutes bacterium]|nr:hypothetical protein [Bacillota bacterium]